MIFLERVRELLQGLLPGRKARLSNNNQVDPKEESAAKANPWTQDLERLACYTRVEAPEDCSVDSRDTKMQLLMEQARLDKAKEALKKQQQQQQGPIMGEAAPPSPRTKRKTRPTDATITDGKAWWGEAVATWNPEDAKNLGPQGEIRHPRQHKWFNQ